MSWASRLGKVIERPVLVTKGRFRAELSVTSRRMRLSHMTGLTKPMSSISPRVTREPEDYVLPIHGDPIRWNNPKHPNVVHPRDILTIVAWDIHEHAPLSVELPP